jgi:hypothetical protein
MAPKYEPAVAAAVVGAAGWQLWSAWNTNAPSLADCRAAAPSDTEAHLSVKQRLMDADLTVGSLALIIGVSFALLSRDATVLLIMIFIFGTLSLWHHSVLEADAR